MGESMNDQTLERLLAPHPRLRAVRSGTPVSGRDCIVYWVQRAQRGIDNPALDLAIAVGNAVKLPVIAVFALTADYPEAQRRHYRFLVEGLRDVEADMAARGVPLVVRLGSPALVVPAFALEVRASLLVGDENPVRIGRKWREQVARALLVPFHLVDADVVVPTSLFPKRRVRRAYPPSQDSSGLERLLETPCQSAGPHLLERTCAGRGGHRPRRSHGEAEGRRNWRGQGLSGRHPGGPPPAAQVPRRAIGSVCCGRNEPCPYSTTELSAHLHFGQISPLTIALEALKTGAPQENIDSLLEELIVRRELAINFVARNPDYDRLAGCPEWARKTLATHAADPRPVLYTRPQLEAAETHDPLWNAAQKEMVADRVGCTTICGCTGRRRSSNGRPTPRRPSRSRWISTTATRWTAAIPSGYTGVAWAIGGKHDRPWPERPIFGTVRFMSYESTRKKFNSAGYIAWVNEIARQ